MRVRGLDVPIEVGVPGLADLTVLRRDLPAVAGSLGVSGVFDPTGSVLELAADHALDRLEVTGLRLDTCNEVQATEDWRQQIYDLAHTARSG